MKRLLSTLLLASALLLSGTSQAQEAMAKIQSLYIYNFAKNIQWSNVSDKYVIGVFADNATFEQLKSVLAVRKFNGKSFELKKLSSSTQASSCHIVFVGQNYAGQVKKIATAADLSNTLLVSEKGQLNNGAAICFVLQNSKLKFKINEAACKASGLQVSNDLMALSV